MHAPVPVSVSTVRDLIGVCVWPQGFCCCIRRKKRGRVTAFNATQNNVVARGRTVQVNKRSKEELRMAENKPVGDVTNTGDAMYAGSWVAEVSVCHPNGELIRKYRAQQDTMELVCVAVCVCGCVAVCA